MTDPKHSEHRDAKERVAHAYETAREKVDEAVGASRERAKDAARQATDAIETNPLAVIVGGLAIGALAASVILRSAREKELLAPLGKRIGATAGAALAAAKESGRQELETLGLTKDAARDQVRSLFSDVAKAATSAANAGVQAARDETRTH